MKLNAYHAALAALAVAAVALYADPAAAQVIGGGGGDIFTTLVQTFRSTFLRGLVMFVAAAALVMWLLRMLSFGWAVSIVLACASLGMLDTIVDMLVA